MCRGALANHTMCEARVENIAYIKCRKKRATSGIAIILAIPVFEISQICIHVDINENEKLLKKCVHCR